MTTWKTLAKRTNSLPPDWSTAEDIAADLDCEPQEVPKILAAAIASGTVEKRSFPYWTPGSRQLLYQAAYRQRPANATASTLDPIPSPSPIGGRPRKPPYTHAELVAAVHSSAARHPGLTPGATKHNMPKRFRTATIAQVAEILGTPLRPKSKRLKP